MTDQIDFSRQREIAKLSGIPMAGPRERQYFFRDNDEVLRILGLTREDRPEDVQLVAVGLQGLGRQDLADAWLKVYDEGDKQGMRELIDSLGRQPWKIPGQNPFPIIKAMSDWLEDETMEQGTGAIFNNMDAPIGVV